MTRIRFEDLPSTNTPRNAENLNKLNNVVISPTEPTTGEEVWIKRGKNLFNPNTDIEFTDGYRDWYGKGAKIDDDSKFGLKIQVEPNKTYVTNSDIPYMEYHNLCFFNSKMVFISSDAYNTNDKTFTTPENCAYVTIALPKTYTWFELEEGSTYTSKKIYTKNDNGVYEELYKKTILFEGSTTDTTIPLVDDYKNYEEIEIITYLQGTYNTHKHYTDYNTINLTDIQSAGDKWQQIRTGRGTFSGKTLTIDRVIGININMENYTFQSFEPTLEVKKVIGINKKN
jgi:hypothetical protein